MDIGIILTIGIITFLLVSTFVGFVRGSKKSLFRFLTVVLSAAFAFVAVVVFKNMLGSETTAEQFNTILAQNGMQKVIDIIAASPLLEEVLLKTAGGLVAPILFFVLFFAASTVTYILYFIITLIIKIATRPKKAKNTEEIAELRDNKTEETHAKGKKHAGLDAIFALLLGFGQGVIVTAALLLTVISYTLIVPQIKNNLESSDALNEGNKASVLNACDTVEKANNAPIVAAYRSCGLDLAASNLTGFEVELESETVKIDISNEIAPISEILLTFMDLSGSKMADYGEEEAVLIQRLGQSFTKSKILSLAGTELVHSATQSWKNNEPFAGIAVPTLSEDMKPIMTKLINIFNESTTSSTTFNEDIITATDLIAVMAKNGLLSATTKLESDQNALFDCIAKDGVISEITLTLNTNKRMSALVPEITNLGLKTLANTLGIATNTTEIYNKSLENIAKYITDTKSEEDVTKRIETLKPLLENEFENIGVTIDPEYIDILTPALIEDFGSFDGEITPEFISEFFDIYNNAMSPDTVVTVGGIASHVPTASHNNGNGKKYTFPKYANGTESTGAANAGKNSLDLIESAAPEKKEALKATVDIISGMRSSETATINRVTLEDFLVDTDCVITNPVAESAALESIVKEVVTIMDSLKEPENNGVETIKNLSTGLGEALDSLSNTEMYGSDKTITLFTAILQSDTLRETTKISVQETTKLTDKHRENSDKVSFGSLMNVIGSTVDVVTSMQKENITVDSIEDLIDKLTPENSLIMKEVITTERMESMGIPADKAETSTEIMGDLFENLGKITDPKTYATEAKAVQTLINIGIAAKDNASNNATHLFTTTGEGAEPGKISCTADEMVDNIMSSSAVCDTILATAKEKGNTDPFGVSVHLTETDRTAIKSACDNYVSENLDKAPEDVQKMTDTLDSIMKLIGIIDWTVPTV